MVIKTIIVPITVTRYVKQTKKPKLTFNMFIFYHHFSGN